MRCRLKTEKWWQAEQANYLDQPATPKNPAAVKLGRLGGRSTSPEKAAAAKANGRKGGRPRKEKA